MTGFEGNRYALICDEQGEKRDKPEEEYNI
jgi:hypothetical protein